MKTTPIDGRFPSPRSLPIILPPPQRRRRRTTHSRSNPRRRRLYGCNTVLDRIPEQDGRSSNGVPSRRQIRVSNVRPSLFICNTVDSYQQLVLWPPIILVPNTMFHCIINSRQRGQIYSSSLCSRLLFCFGRKIDLVVEQDRRTGNIIKKHSSTTLEFA